MEKFSVRNLLISCCIFSLNALKFDDITSNLFYDDSGLIAAFGHFNSDEFTDIFSLQDDGRKLQVLLGYESKKFQAVVNCSFESTIISVVPADFNADSVIDILVVLDSTNKDKELKILWGNHKSFNCNATSVRTIINEPVIFDFNGDMIPDIMYESVDGNRHILIASSNKSFSSLDLLVNQKLKNPHSSALIDLNGDLATDILISGEKNFEMWINIGGEFVMNGSINYPNQNIKYLNHNINQVYPFQSTFVDLNLDAQLDHIIPVCYDSSCLSSAVLVFNSSQNEWEVLLDNFEYQNISWGFRKPTFHAMAMTLRTGDVDMDGYPDFLAVFQSKLSKKSKLVILKNTECSLCKHCYFDRCLKIEWEIQGLEHITNIEVATFFDIFEDGVLDILVTSKTDNEHWKMHALRNVANVDSCFMKVLVLSGQCPNCNLLDMPYGVNQPGPLVLYNMTTQDGHPLVSSAVQMSQTAYFALQLPYCLFGLGQTPNFVDALTVAVPSKFKINVHKREWNQIIPNSQIVVIPSPPYEEKKWVKRLFVTPSHYVMLTCIALIGTCIFISILVALLHWKERKEDKKEKMQDAYRFHFDAM